MKYLIDTDIGDDTDDAFALYMAMKLGYDIVGITTCFLHTEKRARLTKKLLKTFGGGYENVPVYAGHSIPIDERREHYQMCQYTPDLECLEYQPNGVDPDETVDFIIDCCKKYKDQLCVIAIGPFTNIARAIEKDPHAFDGIGRFIIMGGAYYKQYADWNVLCDVPAADIMFRNIPSIEAIGADVTHKTWLEGDERQRVIGYSGNDATARLIGELYRVWQESHGTSARTALHDPLAIYYASHPEVCETQKQRIVVMTDGYARGMTLNVDAYGKSARNPIYKNMPDIVPVTVAREVNKEQIMNAFLSLFE